MNEFNPPDMANIEVPEGCVSLKTPYGTTETNSYVDGDPEGSRLRTSMFVRESDRRLIAKIWWGPDAEGPPGHAHGGSMAAVLDNTMGVCCWVEGYPVLAASITIDFLRGLPLAALYTVESWVNKVEGKKIYAAGKIFMDDDDKPYAEGHGLFIHKTIDEFKKMMGTSAGFGDEDNKMESFLKKYSIRPSD